ncbi:hypothetical protein KLP28_06000 [Nocardioidaceae bacterium]|nr:hypothetical protein KLP28_06000 [Nocardioidaceae bacterium]
MGQTFPTRARQALLACTAVATTATLTLMGGPAHAAVHQHGDAYGDTSSRTMPAAKGALARQAPADGLGDITSLVIGHQYETVDVQVGMADLRPSGDVVAVRVRLKTPSGSWAVRVADVARDGAYHRVVKMRTPSSRGAVDCDGVTGVLDYDLDTATVRVPRTCLGGDPAWVRVGATSRLRDGGQVQLDDAQRVGRAPKRTALSPRIVA